MNATTRTAIVLALLLQGLAVSACEDRGSVTGPTTTTRVTAAISISGVVYDIAHRLLSGARVEVIDGTVVTGATTETSSPRRRALWLLSPMERDGLSSQGRRGIRRSGA